MTGKQRMIAALEHRETDRIPRFWQCFWDEFLVEWRKHHPGTDIMRHFGNDMLVVVADETMWPTTAGVIRDDGDERIVRNGWGQVQRLRGDAHFSETIEVAITERVDPDAIVFDDPLLDSRYEKRFHDDALQDEWFLFCKTGGPYLRSAFLRGEEQFWVDIMDDPGWVRAFVDRVTDHLTAIGVESIRRWGMGETGIAIYDDVAANWGPFVGADMYEQFFLPPLRRMVKAYRDAGARFIMHHSDGNVLPLLDMWIDAGIDAINPVEYRSGMDAVKLREKYGNRLTMIGGLDNCSILPRGDRTQVRDHVLHLLEAGRGGGYVIGPHSIGPDISVDTMLYVLELVEEHGTYPLAAAPAQVR
jgi:uroporphyrinogen decarboxylase